MLTRRSFLAAASTAVAWRPQPARRPRIVLRSSWQTVNIGDIAHTPGALALLERHVPHADVTLWASPLNDEVRALLRGRFPRLTIVEQVNDREIDGTPVAAALTGADLLIHGSGPSIVSPGSLVAARARGLKYGVYGVTLDTLDAAMQETVGKASFFYCRDTDSLAYLQGLRLPCPVQEFVPDATFALDLHDAAAADRLLETHRLEPKRFLCVVPRLRYTPYPRIVDAAAKGDADAKRRLATNDEYAERDHAKLRDAIVAWVRETGGRVLLCPEMTYQVPLLRPLLYDGLPDATKRSVAVMDRYWLTAEAASTYARAALVLSCEMHSPIIALANGTPAIHVRQPTDTRKGKMWADIGLDRWLFPIDETAGADLASRVLEIAKDPSAASREVVKAMAFVRGRQDASMGVVARALATP